MRDRCHHSFRGFTSKHYCHSKQALPSNAEQTLLQTISSSLNGTAIEAFWAGTSFLLTSTVFQPSWASFSHIIGRKPVLLVSMGIFTAGTIIASLANNSATLLVGRSVQGIGGGGMVALTYVIVTDMVTLRERGKWFSLITLQWAIGSVSGPVIGGVCSEKTNWYVHVRAAIKYILMLTRRKALDFLAEFSIPDYWLLWHTNMSSSHV